MTDWIAASLWLHSPISAISLAGVISLSGKSALGHGPADKARQLAKLLFKHMGADLQRRMESALNQYETSDDVIVRSFSRIILPDEPDDSASARQTRIQAIGAEAIRNELSAFLQDGSEQMVAWRSLRNVAEQLSAICNQLRMWCMVTLATSVLGLLVAGIGQFVGPSPAVYGLAQVLVVITIPCVFGLVVYLSLLVRHRNRLSPLEDRYDDLLA